MLEWTVWLKALQFKNVYLKKMTFFEYQDWDDYKNWNMRSRDLNDDILPATSSSLSSHLIFNIISFKNTLVYN